MTQCDSDPDCRAAKGSGPMRSDTLTRFYVVLHAPVNGKAPSSPHLS